MDYRVINPCYVCGAEMNGDRQRILANGRSVPFGNSWRVRCSVEDFNKIVFRNKEVWGTFVRAIIVELDNNRPVYRISGITQDCMGIEIILPKDRNLAVLGFPLLGGRSCKFERFKKSISMVEYPRAHLIHARCWDLIERLFGCEAVEKNLKILLDIFQERWRHGQDNKNACYDFLREDLLWRKKLIIYHDPVKILPLRAVVEESIQRACQDKILNSRLIFRDIKQTADSGIFQCEIQCMIVDLLDYKNIPHLLRGFGWVLPNSYWSSRFPKDEDLVFELDDLRKGNDDEIDWQFLTLGVEKLLQRSPGLLNRRRLLPVLRQARDLFFEEVQAQETEKISINS